MYNPYEMEDEEGFWGNNNDWLRQTMNDYEGYSLESTMQGQQIVAMGLSNVSRKNTLKRLKEKEINWKVETYLLINHFYDITQEN